MKKYLIALAAMAVAVSSCTEKMSSGDKVHEQTKLVKRITYTVWHPNKPDEVEITITSDFTYDSDNRIVKIISKWSNDSDDELRTTTESRVYSENTVTIIRDYDDRSSTSTVMFDGNKVAEVIDDYGSYSFYYGNNSEKATAVTKDGELVYEFVWDKLGNMVRLVGQDPEEEYVLPVAYTSTVNKCNIAIENMVFGFFMLPEFIERNVFGSVCSNYLVSKIGEGDESSYSYKFDDDGYPIEVYNPGKVYENGHGWESSQKYELEYY